ncbi:MAG: hypothetical protein J6X70_11050 [Muribaculaceae bacterium]|nr:hypothetical protein [Muribaculaceae bacterium]
MDYELDNMRQQMAILQEKLDKQTIVTDRIMRNAIRKSMGSISKRYLMVIILAIIMIPYSYWAFVMLSGMSMALWIATSLLMVACAIFTYYNGKSLRDSELLEANLLESKKRVARSKKRDNIWLYFSLPIMLLWTAWVAWELAEKLGNTRIAIITIAIGFVVGLLLGLKIHLRNQRNYREILNQIEDLENTTE